MNMQRALHIGTLLLIRDLRILKSAWYDFVTDALFWTGSNVLIAGYLLPLLGLDEAYGSFMLIGSAVSMCLFYAVNKGQELVIDFEGKKSIEYDMLLPMPSWIVFLVFVISIAVQAGVINILGFPLGKLLLGCSFPLASVSWSKAILLFITINLFFGCFGLWLASWVAKPSRFAHVWMRLILPLWSFGGYQFSWATLKGAYPLFGWLSLLNPLLYTFEGMRTVILGRHDLLDFWTCFVMLWVFILIFGSHAILFLKKRLDFV